MSNYYDTIIIDGNNFLFRAFFVNRPDKFVNELNVTPIHQFLYMLKSVTSQYRAKKIILTWDKKLNSFKKNFRRELVPYKEHRVENDKTTQLLNTISHIQKFIDALGIQTILPVNMEADDVIRYLTINTEEKTLIVSSDHDLLQLIRKNIHVFLPTKNLIVDIINFQEYTNCKTPEMFVLFKSILGDKSDNISGLEKYGKVKAKNLAEKIYKNNNIDFSNVDLTLTEEQQEIINRNLLVMDLSNTEVVYPEEYSFYKKQEEINNPDFNEETLKDLFTEYECIAFLNNFNEWKYLFDKNKSDNDLLSFIRM